MSVTKLLLALVLTFVWLTPAYSAPQNQTESDCYFAVQGKVAWNLAGQVNWTAEGLPRLCAGVEDIGARIGCFKDKVDAGLVWHQAADQCRKVGGSTVSRTNAKRILRAGQQCIINLASFSLRVEWYNPGDLAFQGDDHAHANNARQWELYKEVRSPTQTDDITIGNTSCSSAGNRLAILRIIGGTHESDFTHGVVAVDTALAGSFTCIATSGFMCTAAGALGGTIMSGLTLPNAQEIIYVGVPSSAHHLAIIGTVQKASTQQGEALPDPLGSNTPL